ncbi:hypothetical protein TNIN_33491 [Trichonephila inaurata madagascariensis]|uniref:Uncharacterized protein n=1 Tax=Trichonephila inaurata madagascariensis TaxID=2747483 RepID=A0A8X7CNB8_9ARAC|nr:hypothetical protein TNIN_33491 [Trichonephila inaurata madagascariensis]
MYCFWSPDGFFNTNEDKVAKIASRRKRFKMKRDYCTWDLVGEWTVFRFVYWPAKSQVPFLAFRHEVGRYEELCC